MAVTGAIFKALTFNGESSRNYGVYITGEAVYNAPSRDVEMITIPGRNGSFPLDHGRFENIEVTYPAGVFADNEADFADAISDFRNMLCSASGYCRLEDEYNPDEYRLAVYKSGLEVEPAALKAGEFDITFECKPQRYLKSGETPVTMTSGGTLTNPTKFKASPLLGVEGYGNIYLAGQTITVNDLPYGHIETSELVTRDRGGTNINNSIMIYLINTDKMDTGDEVTISGIKETFKHPLNSSTVIWDAAVAYTTRQNISVTYATGSRSITFYIEHNPHTIHLGSSETWTDKLQATITWTGGSETVNVELFFNYTSSNNAVTITPRYYTQGDSQYLNIPAFAGDSTKSILGDPSYIDCESGNAYMVDGGITYALNNAVQMPSELPVIPTGESTVTFDNTITELEVVPRWWKV